MSEEPEGDKGGSADSAAPKSDPPVRDSHLTIDAEPANFPNDSKLSASVRRIDHVVGLGEQGLVFGLLVLVVFVASLAAIHDKVTPHHLGRWWHTIVRGGTFSIAMFAAAFATHEQRNLAMDLISRKLNVKGRLVLGLALKLLTIAICVALFESGLHQRAVVGQGETLSLFGIHINDIDVVTTISIGAALIILHNVLHFIIDVDYLARGVAPPERMRAH
ncbi:MAG: TRAP transporter small permease subunit [Kofleriaceae bacterium]